MSFICLPRINFESDAGPDTSVMTANSGYHLIGITGNKGQDGGGGGEHTPTEVNYLTLIKK